MIEWWSFPGWGGFSFSTATGSEVELIARRGCAPTVTEDPPSFLDREACSRFPSSVPAAALNGRPFFLGTLAGDRCAPPRRRTGVPFFSSPERLPRSPPQRCYLSSLYRPRMPTFPPSESFFHLQVPQEGPCSLRPSDPLFFYTHSPFVEDLE